ncbi:D-TA family PLP-dependent enzyme [Sphingobacterium sp. ML3W]|uniref:D-TA family PLP-dependent enzyme n=1 Tax=Sphingobacterium sp. ML3W TaxID=1538644 RepID=UPI00190F2578|nr:D-TA family PLP-dependent enzyme [Sphingobacterium sp. ML3W]
MMKPWYVLNEELMVDSPALLVYEQRVDDNIQKAIAMVGGDTSRIRPHVKTNKSFDVCAAFRASGIHQFKCATIAEAEVLGEVGAKDALLAYQPVGPKITRLIQLKKHYPKTIYSCLIDHVQSARALNEACLAADCHMDVYIDVNIGMNRTGASIERVEALAMEILALPGLRLLGVHGYDGHIYNGNSQMREEQSHASYVLLLEAHQVLLELCSSVSRMIIGGTPSFSYHSERPDVVCSPGTFVFWDYGYEQALQEQPFEYAALLMSRVISIIDKNHLCLDLGYKAVACESSLPRVHFLNGAELEQIGQSEEHMVVKVPDSVKYEIGHVFYAVPRHICPTVAMYEKLVVVVDGDIDGYWSVKARDRKIKY